MKIIVVLSMLMLAIGTANAAGGSGEIKHFYISANSDVLIGLVNPQAGCGTADWQFQFSMDSPVAKEWVSMILMARASGTTININYLETVLSTGRCEVSAIWF
ncbi:MAG: hypothetical protein KZQ85_10955 [Candidatus Thiodiazotropha sp. (ex Myrtea sp. 'scaly one' KF741663)]|nr:hypothetical protein [Candidatus Thiodiazotropha sp. (ex Myrtea sp. 'scaly one' KF741663)]